MRRRRIAILAAASVLLHAPRAVRAADPSMPRTDEAQAAEGEPDAGGSEKAPRLRADEMPAVEVVGRRAPELREEDRVGDNEQPRWTAHRRFPSTRIYVL